MTEYAFPGSVARELYEEFHRALRGQLVWVMDDDWYRKMRRDAGVSDGKSEDEWEPDPGDRLLGQRMLVRPGGGKPHLEWLTPDEFEGGTT